MTRQTLQSRWDRFWFQPSAPTNLAVCRLLFCAAFFLIYRHQRLSEWASVSPAFWMPISFFRDLHLGVLPAGALQAIDVAWKVAVAASCLGLWTRVSTALAFGLGAYVLGLPHNFGKTHNLDAIVLLAFGALALSRCGDAWSLDRWFQKRRGKPAPEASGEYTWPVRLVWTLMTLVFFGAGVSKLRHSGLEWIFSENLAMIMLDENAFLSRRLAMLPIFCEVIAAGAILLEVGAPLALFSRRARWIWVPGLFLMQAGIWIVMNVKFSSFMVCYLFWVPWGGFGGRVEQWWRRIRPSRPLLERTA